MTERFPALQRLLFESRDPADGATGTFAFLDEDTKRRLRRALLLAVAVPGYQVPIESQDMPIPRGWGTGGLQVTLAVLTAADVVKVIDQGEDDGVNAAGLRRFIVNVSDVKTTTDAREATLIQTRHRIPESALRTQQILILQVPEPDPLSTVESDPARRAAMHAEIDYNDIWLGLYEDHVTRGALSKAVGHPCQVAGHYVIAPSPIPLWDIPKLDNARCLMLFGAGREGRVYAIPPHTPVSPLTFDDLPLHQGPANDQRCDRCGSSQSLLVEVRAHHGALWACSDTDWCQRHKEGEQ
ncbi:alpha-D-ribose 1-methylphosphonate 5-phosphate C-P-lyase PhnJ [Nocardia africana]|uniref:Alpha-D-ribose 1-methylphosphonate 5-phosphate C-P-lyase PhnJ n=1 Tax=Nocardia africana TaxID=134964 RepID=A0ABW6NRQ0_9NOCA